MGLLVLKLGKFQAGQDELVTPELTKPSQVFQTKRAGRNHDTEADSSESHPPGQGQPVAFIELGTTGYFSLTPNLNKKRKKSNSLPLSDLLPYKVVTQPWLPVRIMQGT